MRHRVLKKSIKEMDWNMDCLAPWYNWFREWGGRSKLLKLHRNGSHATTKLLLRDCLPYISSQTHFTHPDALYVLTWGSFHVNNFIYPWQKRETMSFDAFWLCFVSMGTRITVAFRDIGENWLHGVFEEPICFPNRGLCLRSSFTPLPPVFNH